MGHHAHIDAAALASLDFETAFASLPARARADVAWTRVIARTVIERLRTEPLTEALIRDCARAFEAPLAAVVAATKNAAAPVASADSAESLSARIAAATTSAPSALDTFESCMAMLHAVVKTSNRMFGDEARGIRIPLARTDLPRTLASHFVAAQVLLAAVVSVANDAASGSVDADLLENRLPHLIDSAFVELTKAIDALGASGYPIDERVVATETARRHSARAIPTADDVRALVEAGRMRDARAGASGAWAKLLEPPKPRSVPRRASDTTEAFLANDAWISAHREQPEYEGKWVALRAGVLVDSDVDGGALQQRVARLDDAERVLVTPLR